jgi:DNA-binding MurR/RpiR family transcriptional regulator
MTAPEATQDYAGLVAALVARQGSLSRRLAQVAQFCLNNPEDVAINNIVGLARLIGVAPANITRFAKEMGFAGFAELQEVFRQRLIGPRSSYADRMTALAGGGADLDLDQPGAVFDTFLQSAVDSLLRLHAEIDRAALARAVDVLAGAEAVHVVAARGAFGIGAYALYGLSRVGKRAHLIDNLGAMRAEQAAAMGDRDVLLALTFDDYTFCARRSS